MQATKWLKLPLFLSLDELKKLLLMDSRLSLVPLSGVFASGMEETKVDQYLAWYGEYLENIRHGKPSNPNKKLISAWTIDLSAIEQIPVATGYLVRPCRPVVQVQPFWLNYSTTDGKFHEMAFSQESLAWGLQLSFPQLFQDPATMDIVRVQEPLFPNAGFFKEVQRFARRETVPTPFLTPDGASVNHPCRIGKVWISEAITLPQLALKGLRLCP